MIGVSPETFAKDFDMETKKVYMLRKQEGVRIKDCPMRFSMDSIVNLGPKTFRILVKWQGNKLILPKFVDRAA